MNLKMVATLTCDEYDPARGRGCTETATYEAPLSQDTAGFVEDAAAHFRKAGWKFGGALGFCFCPTHNLQGR